ncbi:MAG: hypothetical protein CL840_08955 [Crocinitomicaceae bacterium]|nr:hypothetical protein [Crocinitomicaceae bacterium]|tara:strand:- start:28689 stop:29372 length:684 start_codon:yes stop_codon:yes gene_type:complete
MPHPGGSSTTAGVMYQNWFLALQLSYAFFEPSMDIFPEALRSKTVIVDDIAIRRGNQEIYNSVKYQAPGNVRHWSMGNLKSENILDDFKKQHEATPLAEIYLVSECGCYLFSEVFNRAKNATGQDIQEELGSKHAIRLWDEVKHALGYNDLKLIQFAKQVYCKTLPLEEIKYLIKHRFSHLVKGTIIEDTLFSIAMEASSNKTLMNKQKLNDLFKQHSIILNYHESS